MSIESDSKPRATAPEIQSWMIDYITAVIDIPKDNFPVADTFTAYGLDSVELTIMCGMIEEAFAIDVSPEELFEHPSVLLFSQHLAAKVAADEGRKAAPAAPAA